MHAYNPSPIPFHKHLCFLLHRDFLLITHDSRFHHKINGLIDDERVIGWRRRSRRILSGNVASHCAIMHVKLDGIVGLGSTRLRGHMCAVLADRLRPVSDLGDALKNFEGGGSLFDLKVPASADQVLQEGRATALVYRRMLESQGILYDLGGLQLFPPLHAMRGLIQQHSVREDIGGGCWPILEYFRSHILN